MPMKNQINQLTVFAPMNFVCKKEIDRTKQNIIKNLWLNDDIYGSR